MPGHVANSEHASFQSIAEYQLPRGRLVVGFEGEAPDWLRPTTESLLRFVKLPTGWDSYGGRTVDPFCASAALELLLEIMRDDSPAPTVVPTGRGGIQLEWHVRGIDLEVEVCTPQRLLASFEDASTGEAWDRELTRGAQDLSAAIVRLSEAPA